MSTIAITFERLPNGPTSRGEVVVMYNDGNETHPLVLRLTGTISLSNTFSLVPYVDGVSGESELQAGEYRLAFNRDYRNVGGSNNLVATVSGDVVTITSQKGTFPVGLSAYTGDVLNVTFFVTNVAENKKPKLTVTPTGNGDCTNIEYSITANGDTSPWRLNIGATDINTNWDGTAEVVNLNRDAIQHLIQVKDQSSQLLDEVTQIVPRKLKIGEFKTRTTQNIGSSDVLIENVNPVANTGPIEYSLDAQGTLTGGAYQTSNVFSGVFPGFYELFVKDKYGCEVTKTIQVSTLQDASQEQNPRYFDVMKGNSIIMSECKTFDKDVKPNFNNTLSHNELSGINYNITQYFNEADFEPIQIKSSYPYHVCTLHKDDGTKQDLPLVLIQENLGSKEKVDCQLEPLDYRTKVYFDGGNEYEPDTTTVLGASPYTQFLPSWAIEGQLISIDGMGTNAIVEEGYDSTLQRGYFVIEASIALAMAGKIQVIYNIQPYNLFECYVPFTGVNKARVVIEKGFSFNEIDGNPWMSELLQVKEDEYNDLLIECSSTKNQSDIVFFSGIKYKKRIKGIFEPIFPNSSEIAEGDSRAYSLDQVLYQHYRLELERISAREVNQLMIWSKTNGFKINGESLVLKGEVSYERLGQSNFYTLEAEYAQGGNSSAVQPDSVALNPSTGTIGGGSTGKPAQLPAYDGKTRLTIDGGFVRVGEDFISIDV